MWLKITAALDGLLDGKPTGLPLTLSVRKDTDVKVSTSCALQKSCSILPSKQWRFLPPKLSWLRYVKNDQYGVMCVDWIRVSGPVPVPTG